MGFRGGGFLYLLILYFIQIRHLVFQNSNIYIFEFLDFVFVGYFRLEQEADGAHTALVQKGRSSGTTANLSKWRRRREKASNSGRLLPD